VNCAKTAEPIEIPFGADSYVGKKNHVLDGSAYRRHLANMVEQLNQKRLKRKNS